MRWEIWKFPAVQSHRAGIFRASYVLGAGHTVAALLPTTPPEELTVIWLNGNIFLEFQNSYITFALVLS